MLDYKFQTQAVIKMMKTTSGQITLPTGTGKSQIQAKYIEKKILKNSGFGVYVIATPRILLTNQLMKVVVKSLVKKKISLKRITVHSGKQALFTDVTDANSEDMTPEQILAEKRMANAILNHCGDGTLAFSSKVLKEEVEKAKREDVPVLICSTYHSLDRIPLALKNTTRIDALLCDESQYIVSEDFNKSVEKIKAIADSTFYFTATRKTTSADDGLGHNNESFYGKADFFTRTPLEMIEQGYIVRPRLHLVEASGTREEALVGTVIESYKEHRATVNGDPKLLVVCSGSSQLNDIRTSTKFKRFVKQQGKNFKVFDASSEFGFNVNDDSIKREEFLEQLNSHDGAAIVFHINMLAEGIDVPDISGVLPLVNLKKSKFLQTLGRSTRLHPYDRVAFTAGEYLPDDLGIMMKPYAYVIIPVFTDEGADRSAYINEIISDLRDHGFDPAEDVIIRKRKGMPTTDQIVLTTKPTKRNKGNMLNTLFEIYHSIEEEKFASLLATKDYSGALELVK